jgi:hypothetical protein
MYAYMHTYIRMYRACSLEVNGLKHEAQQSVKRLLAPVGAHQPQRPRELIFSQPPYGCYVKRVQAAE